MTVRAHRLRVMSTSKFRRPTLGANTLLLLVTLYLVVAVNARFWGVVFSTPSVTGAHGALLTGTVFLALFALTLLMLLPLGLRWVFKPALTVVLLLSAGAAFFMGDFGAVIDRHALASVFETDVREAGEWLSSRMLLYILFLGVLPAVLVWWVDVRWRGVVGELWARIKLVALAFLLLGVAALAGGKDVASLMRNRMEMRHLINPFSMLSATLSWLDHARNDNRPLERIALDASRSGVLPASSRPMVIVLAIGESARASSLDLNGYYRDTDVELHPMPIVNFSRVSSCGTNTATSLPCMFSGLGRKDYEDGVAKYRENLLDVLMRGGYDVLWLDNNTGSKGLAKRAKERSPGPADYPEACGEDGCYDSVLLAELGKVLPTLRRDTVIVVHLLGSHGPAYHARYPRSYAAFTPECMTNELQKCSDVQLRNTYDNTILYTSHVLAGVTTLLGEPRAVARDVHVHDIPCLARRGHAAAPDAAPCPGGASSGAMTSSAMDRDADRRSPVGFDAMMLFVSDHGESLGEHGLYLHGAPYAIAPDEQTHVPMLLWSSTGFAARRGLTLDCVRGVADRPISHDHFFHTVLGLAGVSTAIYNARLDALAGCAPAVAR